MKHRPSRAAVHSLGCFLALLILLPQAGCAPAGLSQKPLLPEIQPHYRVLLVSIDGGKPSVMRPLLGAGKLPNLQSLMDSGSWTLEAQVAGPTLTLPSHTTMVTGLPASVHGITWNDYKPERGTVKAETLFDLCGKAGYKCALVYGKEKFRHFMKPGSPDAAVLVEGDAGQVAAEGEKYLRDPAVALVMVHFAQGDSAGHEHGWGNDAKGVPFSPEYIAALESCDAGLGILLKACRESGWERTLVLVTADHGGHDRTHGSEDSQDALIPWVAGGGLAARLGKLTAAVRSTDTAPTVLRALGLPIPAAMAGNPVACLKEPLKKAA